MNQRTAKNMVCLCNAPAHCHHPPTHYSPLRGFHWRDRCSYASALYPIVKKTFHCVQSHKHVSHNIWHTQAQSTGSLCSHEHVYCLVRAMCVCVWGGLGGLYSGAQGNGTWGYSGLNGSSGYTAAHSACMSTAETNAPVHTMSRSTTKDRCVRVTKLSPRCLGFSEWQALSISCNLTGWSECLKRATSNRSGESQVPDANAGIGNNRAHLQA